MSWVEQFAAVDEYGSVAEPENVMRCHVRVQVLMAVNVSSTHVKLVPDGKNFNINDERTSL